MKKTPVSMVPVEFRLNSMEMNSAVWARLKEHLLGRLQILREQNDSPTLDACATARHRGKIEMLKEIIKAGNPPDPTVYDQ